MLLTIFVDASYCQKTKVAGYGSWAKRRDWAIGRFGGGTVEGCKDAAEAELRAIAHALEAVEMAADVECIMIQSDCLRALHLIRILVPDAYASFQYGTAPIPTAPIAPSNHERDSLHRIRDVGRRIMLRHVKGHKEGDGRQWVNAQCDKVAKDWMRGARKKAQEAKSCATNAVTS